MNQRHSLITLFFSCSIITLHAMEEIKFTEAKLSELEPYASLACDVYSKLASPEAKDVIRTSIKTNIFPHIVSLEKPKHRAFIAALGRDPIGFTTYETIDNNTVTFHLSPIKEPHTERAYRQILEMLKEQYPNGCSVYAGCPDYLPGLAELLNKLGYKRVEKYPCSEDYPTPKEGVPAYMLKLQAKDSQD